MNGNAALFLRRLNKLLRTLIVAIAVVVATSHGSYSSRNKYAPGDVERDVIDVVNKPAHVRKIVRLIQHHLFRTFSRFGSGGDSWKRIKSCVITAAPTVVLYLVIYRRFAEEGLNAIEAGMPRRWRVVTAAVTK